MYKNGFGDAHHEFWLGNEALHLLTSTAKYVLRVDLEAANGQTAFAEYTGFSIDSEKKKYALLYDQFLNDSTAGT